MAMAARSSSSVGRRRGRPLWRRSGLERVALLSMLCLAVTAAISVVRAAEYPTAKKPEELRQQFFPEKDWFEDRYLRRYPIAPGGHYVLYQGRALNVLGQPVSVKSGEVTSDEVFVPVNPDLERRPNDEDNREGNEGFMPPRIPFETPTVHVVGDPCDVLAKWKRNHIDFGPAMSGNNINKFVGQVVEAVRKARTWLSGIPLTKAWRQRKNGCTAEEADEKITDLVNRLVGSDGVTNQRMALLDTLRSSLEYRLSRSLSPGKRARCLFRFGKGLVFRWSWRCDKSTAFWKTLKEVSMCVGDRWKICYNYGKSMSV